MEYQILSQDEQDEIVVSFMQAQERDAFCHELNLTRFNKMLETLPEGKYKQRITELRDETASRLDEVTRIITATQAQLPQAERLQAAKGRILAKEAARKV